MMGGMSCPPVLAVVPRRREVRPVSSFFIWNGKLPVPTTLPRSFRTPSPCGRWTAATLAAPPKPIRYGIAYVDEVLPQSLFSSNSDRMNRR
jgi:hypothetical protein